jgi:hypothetical protein
MTMTNKTKEVSKQIGQMVKDQSITYYDRFSESRKGGSVYRLKFWGTYRTPEYALEKLERQLKLSIPEFLSLEVNSYGRRHYGTRSKSLVIKIKQEQPLTNP